MKITENVAIFSLTTMRLGGSARFLVEIFVESEIPEAFKFVREQGLPYYFPHHYSFLSKQNYTPFLSNS